MSAWTMRSPPTRPAPSPGRMVLQDGRASVGTTRLDESPIAQVRAWAPIIEESTKAIELDPGFARAYFLRARYRGRKDPVGAIADLDQAIRLMPDYPEAYIVRAQAWADMGKQLRAISDLSTAMRLDPANEYAYIRRAMAFAALRMPDEAVKDSASAIRCRPVVKEWLRRDRMPACVTESAAFQQLIK